MLINPGDIADGLLVSAVGALVRIAVRPRTSRRTSAELDIAGWADTEALIRDSLPGVKLELPELTDNEARELTDVLESDEVQAALQVLLAARLTDAPETEATQAREAVSLAIAGMRIKPVIGHNHGATLLGRPRASTPAAEHADRLSQYFDDKTCALVGHLEGAVGLAGLRQVRDEAYNSRIVALLGTIRDMMAALANPDRRGEAEADFLARYRGQARQRHGRLQPPDFDRRRRIPISKIYVNTEIYLYSGPDPDLPWIRSTTTRALRSPMKVMDLAEHLDRTVLLGDPGGGKTTAANVLANHFASTPGQRVPFVVTLREYAAAYPPERSVAGHIEHSLKTLYQCPAPDGLVERLLLTGRALVIFDGLDELLETSRRRDVSERVEQFCGAYPLTAVLVTSRLVGYDQAMLDEEQFDCYRLGGFGGDEVGEYARKWFALQEGSSPAEAEAEAEAFIGESLHAQDVRSNPLLLSLMCILYRGAGTLPRDRPAIYAKCAELLLGRWDESRRIRHDLRAGHLVESAIQDLAWWLFTSDNPEATATERQLVDRTTEFLHERAFESREEAHAAAAEFAAFLRGRMWVLSDVGTTADGEKLYGFTHRTFLEYFAAARLAAVSDTPEDLAVSLAPHIMDGGWRVGAELALQLKSRATDRGADRFYAAALDWIESTPGDPRTPEAMEHAWVAEFLASCIDIVDPSPGAIRRLTRVILEGAHGDFSPSLDRLFRVEGQRGRVIADEVALHIAARARSGDPAVRIPALQLIFAPTEDTWPGWSRRQVRLHAGLIVADAAMDSGLRYMAVHHGLLPVAKALQMPGGLGTLLELPTIKLAFTIKEHALMAPYLMLKFGDHRLPGPLGADVRDTLSAVGRHLMAHPDIPWARIGVPPIVMEPDPALWPNDLDETAALGFAALACILAEVWHWQGSSWWRFPVDIRVPRHFQELFREWTAGTVNFADIGREG
ncbi:MAG: NACHT domain-containing protein [Nocardiopsaceae bacterium]|nr:NACHT domain-containing protein [Nocardiopsaceae bacterium]